MKTLPEEILERTSITKIEEHSPVVSVYATGQGSVPTEVLEAYRAGNFVIQRESVTMFEEQEPTLLDVVYFNGFYVGDLQHLGFLVDKGITEKLQPSHEGGGTCAVGFNPTEQKWYGWSHRAYHGFGIGSSVAVGDCAYSPVNKEDLLESIKRFWEHGVARQGGGSNAHMTFTNLIENVRFDVTVDGILGLMYDKNCTCSDPAGPSLTSSDDFEPYPVPWGRGEWSATTLDEAKEMACLYAQGVS